jgi:hypothetical protein
MSPQNAAVPPVAKEQTDLDFEHSKQKLGTASVVGIFETRSWLGKKNIVFGFTLEKLVQFRFILASLLSWPLRF